MTQTAQGLGHVAPHSSGEDLKRELKEVNATPGPSPSNLNKEDLKRELKAQTFFVLPLGRIWL